MAKKLTQRQVETLTKNITRSARKLTIDKLDYGTGSNVSVSVPKLLEVTKTVQRMIVAQRRFRN